MSGFITSSEVGKADTGEELLPMIDFADERKTPRMLEIFGFDGALLRDQVVARAAAASRSYVGGLYPGAAPGVIRWIHSVATLREALAPYGFVEDESDQLSKAVNRERRIAIVPATGSAKTGLPYYVAKRGPTTKYPRGERTIAAVERNSQLPLFLTAEDERQAEPAFQTWMLLQHATAEEVRSELSLPASISAGGFISSWEERFILPPHDNEGGPIDDVDDDDDSDGDPGVYVPVELK
jgi:hypothetical protein